MTSGSTSLAIEHGVLHLTLAIGAGSARATVRDVSSALDTIRRALNTGWTEVPFADLAEGYDGDLPSLPRYEVLRVEMASPLEIAIAVPPEVLTIPAAVAGLTLAIERVLNCKVRTLTTREQLEADRAEHRERRIAAEARIAATAGHDDHGERRLQVTSAELWLDEESH
jgi:hypothetical protein